MGRAGARVSGNGVATSVQADVIVIKHKDAGRTTACDTLESVSELEASSMPAQVGEKMLNGDPSARKESQEAMSPMAYRQQYGEGAPWAGALALASPAGFRQ